MADAKQTAYRDADSRIKALITEMEDWAHGRKSHWSSMLMHESDPSNDRANTVLMCQHMDLAEVQKCSAMIQAYASIL